MPKEPVLAKLDRFETKHTAVGERVSGSVGENIHSYFSKKLDAVESRALRRRFKHNKTSTPRLEEARWAPGSVDRMGRKDRVPVRARL